MTGRFPWSVVISGAVGVAGIAGSVATAHLTNRAAERRLRLEQRQADRTRFHDMRVELYAKVLATSQTALLKVTMLRLGEFDERSRANIWDELTSVMDQLNGATKGTLLLGAPATQNAGATLLDAVAKLTKHTATEEAKFNEACQRHREATHAFAEAARVELSPPSKPSR